MPSLVSDAVSGKFAWLGAINSTFTYDKENTETNGVFINPVLSKIHHSG